MGVVTSVLGPVDATALGPVLAAEALLCVPAVERGNAGVPASAAVFDRAPVGMSLLGRLMMGVPNRDDATLQATDARAALATFAEAGGGTVVVLAGADGSRGDGSPTVDELALLSAASGITIVRGGPGGGPGVDPRDGLVCAPASDPRDIRRGAERAQANGLALALRFADPRAALTETATATEPPIHTPTAPAAADPAAALTIALAEVDAAGLPRERVILVGARRLIFGEPTDGPRLGIDVARLEALLEVGTALCFDDLGRIPTVHTIASDHDIAVAVLRCAELGASDRILLSAGIRQKHRLTAFGGNGLEFVATQFVPYLGMLGADAALCAAVGGGNAAAILACNPAALAPPATSAQATSGGAG